MVKELFSMKGRGDQWLWGINTGSLESHEVPAQFAILQRDTCEILVCCGVLAINSQAGMAMGRKGMGESES